MTLRTLMAAATLAAMSLMFATGCSVMRDQQTVGAFIDDSTITTQIKSRYVNSTEVAASAISVETLNGTVILSGFAKNATERAEAERIARGVNGVKSLKNEILVRP